MVIKQAAIKYFNKNKNNPILNSYYNQIYVSNNFIKLRYQFQKQDWERAICSSNDGRFKKKKIFLPRLFFFKVHLGKKNLEKYKIRPNIFWSDKTNIEQKPFDVVFTNHALEPNGGNEEIILKELLRIANKYVILF